MDYFLDYLWTTFSVGWLICSIIVVLLMIREKRANSTAVSVLSLEINTYADLLYTALIVALGPAILVIRAGGTIERLANKPLPWKKKNVNF